MLVVDVCAHAFLLRLNVRALKRSKRAFVSCLWWPRVRRRARGVVTEPPAVVGLQVDGRPRHEQHQSPPLWRRSMCGEERRCGVEIDVIRVTLWCSVSSRCRALTLVSARAPVSERCVVWLPMGGVSSVAGPCLNLVLYNLIKIKELPRQRKWSHHNWKTTTDNEWYRADTREQAWESKSKLSQVRWFFFSGIIQFINN